MGANVSHETLMSLNRDERGNSYWAKFNTNYFGEGNFRWAFKGTLCGSGPRGGESCVAKVFKAKTATCFETWIPDISVIEKASKYARQFNKLVTNVIEQPQRSICFPIPLVAKLNKNGGFKYLGFIGSGDQKYVKAQEYVALEPYLVGKYIKFNSNGGFEDDDASKLLPAFTHWTFEKSGHNFMICDLQGIIYHDKYVLTDPVVHSAEQLYAATQADLGVVGMEKVMKGHKCNVVCQALGLNRNPALPYKPGLKRTSYNFDLTFEQKQRNQRKYSRYFDVIIEE